ncbi:MAG: PQQ-binding-like beta-propeller repeat protein [Planctomycetaceae bacterium]
MRVLLLLQCCFVIVRLGSSAAQAADWPGWRAPDGTGIAAGSDLPLASGLAEQVKWRAAVPGRGHGSAIVVGDRIYLATAEREREARSLLCLDRASGDVVWHRDVHLGKLTPFKNEKASDASSTPACDGERLFINFLHDGGMYTSAVSLDGELLWQTRVCDYVVHQGFGSSPRVHGPLVLVSADNKRGGAVAGLRREDGTIIWKQDRPQKPNYASPVVHTVCGREQLLMTGCDLVSSFDPLTGDKLWEVEGATTECVTTTIVAGELLFTSGGYPTNHISAVRCDGSGEVAWKNGVRVYVPSMLTRGNALFAVTDAGVAMCWDSQTGAESWKGRLGGGFSASPVLVGDQIWAINEAGEMFVFRASPEQFDLLADGKLGDECFATPTIVGGEVYVRVARREGDRRVESLIRLGAN